ncbi:MAG: transpeptidase family protein [Bacteroidales bacterium]|nr:transpeptidase family protein [Bacteroidales bacterium]
MNIEPKTDTLWKTHLVYMLVLLFGVAILVKIILVQTKDSKELVKLAEKRELRVKELEASRGNIFSYDGKLMATSVPVFDVFFDSQSVDQEIFVSKIDSLSQQMALLIPKRTAAQWKEYLSTAKAEGKRYHPIAKNISLSEYRQMQKFAIFNRGPFKGGIVAEKKTRRTRPYKELAGRLIGYVNENENLYVGLEGAYNDYLKGQNGHQLVRRIHHGDWIPVPSDEDVDAQNGDDLVTTFDINLQDIVESALNNTMVTNKAEQGCAVLMEVETGYVKAIANLKLNHETGQYEESYNFAMAERYEPGSVFKIASMVVLMNHNHNLKLDDKVNIGNGPIHFSNRVMKDDHSFTKNGIATVQEVIEQSSNKGTAVLITKAFMAHPERYVEGLYALGLNKKIGTGIAGEAQPIIKHPDDKTRDGRKIWSNVSLPWMSIGYEVNVTPMHLITLYNAIANGGKMMKPQFVTEIRHGNQTVEKFEPVVLNEQIAPPEAISMLQTMLEGVTQRGTAKRQLKDCIVSTAGKTGTAQYCDPRLGYSYRDPHTGRRLYNTTFVGYFPADKPKYSCIVVVSRARGQFWAAGSVSAPGFREIAEKVYAMRLGTQEDIVVADTARHIKPDNVIVRHDKTLAYLNGMQNEYTDYALDGDWVTIENSKNGEAKIKKAEIRPATVPNLIGMNISDAVYLIESLGGKATFSGQGTVCQQSLQPGDTLRKGRTIALKLE